ncbi:MAG: glycoside hydrolase family 92 protein, partial [Bacteroidota bacterium]
VGDPAGIIIADTYLKGIKDFDVEKAYTAMLKSADMLEGNPLRPGIVDYIKKGYLTTKTTNSGSVSTTQEYNITDYAIGQLARALGKKGDYTRFRKRSISYRKLFDKEFNLLRPRNDDGSWLSPYNPETGANFVKNVGFIEGNAWQYTFMVSHDVKGLIKLMGGPKSFSGKLQEVFDKNQFDMANEPDIAYPYLFNYVKGEEWRTQKTVSELLQTYFKNKPDGLPGNDDTGTMSAWAVFSMIGMYPVSPANPIYTLTTPVFDKVTLRLNPKYYKNLTFTITKEHSTNEAANKLQDVYLDGRRLRGRFVSHKDLVNSKNLTFIVK